MQVTSMASQGSLSGQQLELRPVVASDLAVLRDAWLQLDWEPTMAYMLALREYSSQDGFMVLLFSGQIAGAVLANAMQNCGFIGYFTVLEPFRGHGSGRYLFQSAVQQLERQGVRTIGLDGVEDLVPFYRRMGFKATLHKIRHWSWTRSLTDDDYSSSGDDLCRELSPECVAAIVQYDLKCTGLQRADTLRRLLNAMPWMALSQRSEHDDDTLTGLLLLRASPSGYTGGALYADSPDIAASLLDGMAKRVGTGSPVSIEVMESNVTACQVLTNHNWAKSNGACMTRMWTSHDPQAEHLLDGRVYAVLDAGLG